jgi:hypothetical protein
MSLRLVCLAAVSLATTGSADFQVGSHGLCGAADTIKKEKARRLRRTSPKPT